LKQNEKALIAIQSIWRGYIDRKAYQSKLKAFKSHEDLWSKASFSSSFFKKITYNFFIYSYKLRIKQKNND
jgi:hypothetical protein